MDFEKQLISILKKETGLEEVNLEIPPSSELGDYAFPCFELSKAKKRSPILIAQELSITIKKPPFISKIFANGPYLNFFLDPNLFTNNTLKKIIKEKENYGKSNNKNLVMIEFSQANTHKAFHVGHIRGTALGESLSRILEFSGNNVYRSNYQGDTGMHVAKWIWCYKKYHSKEKIKPEEKWIASIYVDAVKRLANDPDLQNQVDKINKSLEERKDKTLLDLWKKTRKLSLNSFEKIYKELNTHFDYYFFEAEQEKRGREIAKELIKNKIAEFSDGAAIINLETHNLGVWVLLRKDGTVLYSSKDLALAEKKFNKYKINKSIYVVGAAQRLHISQLFKTLELMKFKYAKNCFYVPVSEVRLPTGKMSSRTGDNILYSEFIAELIDYAKSEINKREKLSKSELNKRALHISIAAIKYSMLKQNTNNTIVFNKEEALNFEGNTGPYLLYSYARAKSILNKSKKKRTLFKIKTIQTNEKELISELALFPSIVSNAYTNLSPSLIANYAHNLSQKFNEFYHSNKVIGSEEESFRLALVESFSIVLKNSLNLLGINVIEKM
nr:arginine--tRNA ligase [Nanoarchaeum sp.]